MGFLECSQLPLGTEQLDFKNTNAKDPYGETQGPFLVC